MALLCLPLLAWLWGRLSERAQGSVFDPGLFLLGLELALVLLLLGLLLYLSYCVFTMRYSLSRTQLLLMVGGVAILCLSATCWMCTRLLRWSKERAWLCGGAGEWHLCRAMWWALA